MAAHLLKYAFKNIVICNYMPLNLLNMINDY